MDSQHLRGFRKRWLSYDFRSPGPVSVGSESLPSEPIDLPLSGISEVDSFDQLQMDLRRMDGRMLNLKRTMRQAAIRRSLCWMMGK